MGWSIGYDGRWSRDIGYGVPAICDYPKCNEDINRGLSFVCGAQQPFGGDNGCGLFFCSKHLFAHSFRDGDSGFFCKRCIRKLGSYDPKPDTPEWIHHKLTDKSWEQWRKEHPEEVKNLTHPHS